MQDACTDIEAGMMVILGLDDAAVERVCLAAQAEGKKVWPANYNQDGQLVVAGMRADLASLEQTFKDAGAKRAMLLNMSVASHCDILTPAQIPLKSLMESMIEDKFEAPVISNVTTKAYSTKKEAVELLTEQLVKPVKYKHSIEAVQDKVELFIEFGNGSTLKGLNKKIAKELETLNVSDMNSLSEVVSQICN
jgi:[acyl-carrier-protein] S-malonyltransferase